MPSNPEPPAKSSVKKKGGKKHTSGKILSTKGINKALLRFKNRFLLPSYLKEMKRLNIGGLSGGNDVTLFTDGSECFKAIIASLKSAKYSINLETYIFNSDEAGWVIAEQLAEKAKKGIEVNVIYDAVGSIKTSFSLFNYMKDSGVELIEYHPLFPWKKYWNISSRDHRKLLIVDGKTAFLGGMNIGNQYAGNEFAESGWRDTHIKIQGPAVRDVQFFFMENWFRNGGAIIDNKKHFPEIKEAGKKLLMILCTSSRFGIKPIQESYLSAINNARRLVYITNAYFVPDANFYRAMVRAAKRKVDIRLLLPQKSDVPIVKYASRYLYKRYLKSNIKVYEYNRSVLHAKTAVIDGIWSTIGSTNIDSLSFSRNLEVNAVILDHDFGRDMLEVFCDDLDYVEELTLENWERRSTFNFLLEWLCYRFRKIL